MTNRSLVARLIGPSGLVIAGVGLFLPFGVVSCAVQDAHDDSVSVTYTGADLIGGHEGTLSASQRLPQVRDAIRVMSGDEASGLLRDADVRSTRILLVAVVVLLFIGVLAVLVRRPRIRATVIAAVSIPAVVLLVGAQLSARQAVPRFFAKHRGLVPPSDLHHALPDGVSIRPGAGFWVSLVSLVAVAAGGVVAVLRTTRQADQPNAATAPPGGGDTATP